MKITHNYPEFKITASICKADEFTINKVVETFSAITEVPKKMDNESHLEFMKRALTEMAKVLSKFGHMTVDSVKVEYQIDSSIVISDKVNMEHFIIKNNLYRH